MKDTHTVGWSLTRNHPVALLTRKHCGSNSSCLLKAPVYERKNSGTNVTQREASKLKVQPRFPLCAYL